MYGCLLGEGFKLGIIFGFASYKYSVNSKLCITDNIMQNNVCVFLHAMFTVVQSIQILI